ncbi:MAG: DUF2157 domain-containing protein [Dehalococcoidia bacterium]|uniref:DUF2157 domain-containing protein n=1 Tax=Candidatus Amarobacter glycogenicus TaxID=3140699 RepID=UPI00313570CA|nr:DUF2157 domain-containing protein [Dehalococcoidia bacterium]
MGQIEEHLQRWLEAGILKPETAETIRIFERGQPKSEAAERPGVLEALLYLGVVVLSVGVFSLFVQQWEDLESWARLAAIGVPTLLLLGVGAALHAGSEPQLQRGGQAAWMATVGLFAGFAAVTINEYGLGLGDPGDPGALLAIAGATFALAVILWVVSPTYPQVFAIAGSTIFLGQAVGNWPDDFSQAFAGMTIFAIAVVAIALAEARWLTPLLATRVLFSGLAIMGPFEAGVDRGAIAFELLAGAMAAAVIAYGVLRASFLVVLVGVGGAFFVLINFILRHFSERLGAPVAMMISGGILVAGVFLLAIYRRESQGHKTA